MIRLATVLSQKPSAAKKGSFITVMDDGFGEVRAYTTRRLKDGEKVVVSVRQGASRDPLSTTILTKTQEETWLKENNIIKE